MNVKNLMYLFIVALFSSAMTLVSYQYFGMNRNLVIFEEASKDDSKDQNLVQFTKDGDKVRLEEVPLDFTRAAEKTTPSVVHIKATQTVNSRGRQGNPQMPDLFREFFGDDLNGQFFRQSPQGPRQAQSSGSGVIVSKDGYIVTNNHVVDNATEIEVVLSDQQSYRAEVIGVDPSTDLAVIKIEAENLPNILLGNSDQVKVGQWVLAVGNPFNLESTVTAGIVSAKGRNLNLLRDKDQAPIEAFIQTDAAVNPGNSGGALINPQGELVGINTAIATPTGTYAGYSFAVPVNLVRKVMKDIIEYGKVQRGYLGVTIRQLDGKFAQENDLGDISEGVYVNEVSPDGAAAEAGIKPGDIIIGLDAKKINTSPELLEAIAKRRPGNTVRLKILRDQKEKTIDVVLKAKTSELALVKDEDNDLLRKLGAEFENLSKEDLKKLELSNGVRVARIFGGKLRNQTNMREGFIITKVGDQKVSSVEDLLDKLSKTKGGVLLSGTYEDYPGEYYYGFGM